MILLESGNRILEDIVKAQLLSEKHDASDVRLCDFDDVGYRIEIEKDNKSVMYVSVECPQWNQLKKLGAEDNLKELYGPYVSSSRTGSDVTLAFPFDEIQEDKAELAKRVSMIKSNLTGAPFKKFFSNLQSKGGALEPAVLNLRKDTILYFFPQADRVTIVYSLDFHEKSDMVIAKVFLNEFVEARRSLQSAPICSFDVKPPLEMKHFNITEPTGNLGFLSITILPQHLSTPQKFDSAVYLLQGLRNYLQYHIKCSKAYFHSRMRARVGSLLQIMNRAKVENKTESKAKKTISGRTFVQS